MAKKERTFRVAVAFLPSMSTHREMADGVSRFASEHGNWLLHTIVTRPDNSTDLSSLDPSEFDGAIGDFALPPFNRIVANGVSIPLVVVDPDLLDYGTPDQWNLTPPTSVICVSPSLHLYTAKYRTLQESQLANLGLHLA